MARHTFQTVWGKIELYYTSTKQKSSYNGCSVNLRPYFGQSEQKQRSVPPSFVSCGEGRGSVGSALYPYRRSGSWWAEHRCRDSRSVPCSFVCTWQHPRWSTGWLWLGLLWCGRRAWVSIFFKSRTCFTCNPSRQTSASGGEHLRGLHQQLPVEERLWI